MIARRSLAMLLLFLAAIYCPVLLQAQRAVMEVSVPVPIVLRPFHLLPAGEDMIVKVTNPSATPMVIDMEISLSEGGGGGSEFAWRAEKLIAADASGARIVAVAQTYVGQVSLQPNEATSFKVHWKVAVPSFAVPGVLVMPVDIILSDHATGIELAAQLDVPITLQVVFDSALTIAGTSGSTSGDRTFAFLDFGELVTAESAFIIFGMRANDAIVVEITSQNGGVMRDEDQPTQAVAYAATFDGQPLALKTSVILARRPKQDLTGSRYRLDIVIGDVSSAYAGSYQDTITVEIIAQ